MNHPETYKHARDTAWKTLLDCDINQLPVNLNQIITHHQICIVPYSCAERLCSLLDPLGHLWDGFSCVIESNKCIFFNDSIKTKARRRSTISHELGHIILEHNLLIIQNRNLNQKFSRQLELEANIFSRNLLAPACVLDALGVRSAEEIMRFCDISHTAAKIRLDQLIKLQKQNKFGFHPLERQVLRQFHSFIQQNKKPDTNL